MTATHTLRSRFTTLIDRYPAGTFFVLTLALSWGIWIPTLSIDIGIPSMLLVIPGGFGPLAAAALVTKLRGESVRTWLNDAFDWHRPLRWYGIAFGIPVVISVVMLAAFIGITGRFDESLVPPILLLFTVNVVFASLLGGGQEEFGWRGFALPHLQARFDALPASLIIGVVWAIWHAPLFVFDVSGYAKLSPLLYAASVVSFSVVLTWFYNSSQGCLPATILFHGTINAAVNVPPVLVGGLDALPVPFTGVLAVAFWTVALALLVRHGPETLSINGTVLATWTQTDAEDDGTTASPGVTPEMGN